VILPARRYASADTSSAAKRIFVQLAAQNLQICFKSFALNSRAPWTLPPPARPTATPEPMRAMSSGEHLRSLGRERVDG